MAPPADDDIPLLHRLHPPPPLTWPWPLDIPCLSACPSVPRKQVFGLEPSMVPKLVMGDLRTGQLMKYHFDGEFLSSEEIEEFVEDFLAGKLTVSTSQRRWESVFAL